MPFQPTLIYQFKHLWFRLLLVLLPCILLSVLVPVLSTTTGVPSTELFEDIYETAGSRWSGMVTSLGCLVWCAASSICFFCVYLLKSDNRPSVKTWRKFFLSSGALTTVLLFDDLFGLHELGDDVVMLVMHRDREISGKGKAILESIIYLSYGVLFSMFCWYFRKFIYSTEYIFLLVSTLFFALSIFLDVSDFFLDIIAAWKSAYLFEEYAKFAGILLYTTYFFRTAKQKIVTLRSYF